MSFHEIRFPTDIALGSSGGPERRTEIVVLGSGHEERNTRWANSKRRYDAGYGVKSINDLHAVIEFFEERRGRLYGFRWKDHRDFRSKGPEEAVSETDQTLGVGDGVTTLFQIKKTYGGSFAPYDREIKKPVVGSLVVGVDGVLQVEGVAFNADYTTGEITFEPGHIPASGLSVTAGFEFDVPVRFDTDRLQINLDRFSAGEIPNVPIVEVRL